MPQVSLYMQQETLDTLREEAQRAQTSVSKFVSQLVDGRASQCGWPANYWESVYGCLKDSSFQIPSELDDSLDGSLPSFSA